MFICAVARDALCNEIRPVKMRLGSLNTTNIATFYNFRATTNTENLKSIFVSRKEIQAR